MISFLKRINKERPGVVTSGESSGFLFFLRWGGGGESGRKGGGFWVLTLGKGCNLQSAAQKFMCINNYFSFFSVLFYLCVLCPDFLIGNQRKGKLSTSVKDVSTVVHVHTDYVLLRFVYTSPSGVRCSMQWNYGKTSSVAKLGNFVRSFGRQTFSSRYHPANAPRLGPRKDSSYEARD